MRIPLVQWKPDTCPCVFELSSDTLLAQNLFFVCPAHKALAPTPPQFKMRHITERINEETRLATDKEQAEYINGLFESHLKAGLVTREYVDSLIANAEPRIVNVHTIDVSARKIETFDVDPSDVLRFKNRTIQRKDHRIRHIYHVITYHPQEELNAVYAACQDENALKNRFLGMVFDNFPEYTDLNEDGEKILKKGVEYRWAFDEKRKLVAEIVSASDRIALQNKANEILGIDKVTVR